MAAGGDVRTVARLYLVVGLAAACFALYAISLDPATFRQLQFQMIKEMDLQQLEQGQLVTACAVRAAEAMKMRADAVMLLMSAVGQAVAAMTAIAGTGRLGIVCAQMQSIGMAWNLLDVLAGVVDLAIGRCHGTGTYHQVLSVCYFNITVSFVLLFIYGLLVVLRVQV